MKPRLLMLDDDATLRGQMRWAFCRDYEVIEAGSRHEALAAARGAEVPIGVIDLGLPPCPFEPTEGMRAIRELLCLDPLFKAVIVTGVDEREDAFRALDLGAFDYFTKPVSIEEVRVTLKRAHLAYRQQSGHAASYSGAGWPSDLLGVSPPMQTAFGAIAKLAEVNMPALVIGEPGTGKESAARAMHRLGMRHAMPFVPVDCAAAPEKVLEAELFGTKAPGPWLSKKCKFEQADGGTIYIKEAAALSLRLQARLLRVIREHSIESPLTGERMSLDVRVISSSSSDLPALARAGAFREDLLHRLSVVTLELPPLRDRGEDISLLSFFLLKKHARDFNRAVAGFDREGMESVKSYGWPGNVKELDRRIRRAVIFSGHCHVSGADLGIPAPPAAEAAEPLGLPEARQAFKIRMIQEALARSGGKISRAAAELGISRQYLSRLIARYNLRAG